MRICAEYVEDMRRVCGGYAQGMWRTYAQGMWRIYADMCRVCVEYMRICAGYVEDTRRIYEEYIWDTR